MNFILLALYTILFGVLGLLVGTAGSIIGLLIPGLRDRLGPYFEDAAGTTLHRPAITFGESSDLLFKRRLYDADQGAEVISSGGDQLELANPDASIWSYHGSPLSIVDEWFGVVIDQRHLHPGETITSHLKESTLWVGDYWDWMNGRGYLAAPAYAELDTAGPAGKLQAVRTLFWGGEEADHPDTVKEYVAKANQGRKQSKMWKQLLIPLVFFVVTFGMLWFASQYGGGGGGGSPAPTPVGGSRALLLAATPTPGTTEESDGGGEDDSGDSTGDNDTDSGGWSLRSIGKKVATVVGGLVAAGVLAVVLFALLTYFGPLGLLFVLSAFLTGLAVFPLSGPLLNKRLPTAIAERLGGLYLRLGLLPYDNPDFELSTDGQRVVEGNGNGPRYRLAGKYVAFTLDEDSLEELFGERADQASTVDARQDAGKPDITDLPSDYTTSTGLTYDRVKAMVPDDPSDDKVYLRLDRMTAPFRDANVGLRSRKALENAKEEYGAGWQDLNTKQILWMSFGMGILGLIMGYLVFFGL